MREGGRVTGVHVKADKELHAGDESRTLASEPPQEAAVTSRPPVPWAAVAAASAKPPQAPNIPVTSVTRVTGASGQTPAAASASAWRAAGSVAACRKRRSTREGSRTAAGVVTSADPGSRAGLLLGSSAPLMHRS